MKSVSVRVRPKTGGFDMRTVKVKSSITKKDQDRLHKLTSADVISVYSGKAHHCCCGCAGIHRYNTLYRHSAAKWRGYAIQDEEFNDRQISRVLKIVQANSASAHFDPTYVGVTIGDRWYNVYLVEGIKR